MGELDPAPRRRCARRGARVASTRRRGAAGQGSSSLAAQLVEHDLVDEYRVMIEPVLLVFMGLVIAGLLLALYMPLFQLSSVLA